MKKNAMLKIAAGLMVAVLLTTCAVSSTFAKYITTADAVNGDTARTAIWGLNIATSTDNEALFAKTYSTNGDTTNSVNGAAKIVAPGTSNSGTFSTTISGVTEVSFALSATAAVTLDGWGDRCPLIFTIASNTYQVGTPPQDAPATAHYYANTSALVTGLIGAIETEIGTTNYPASTAVNEESEVEIAWSWPFIDANENEFAADENGENGPTVAISLTYTAAQIDTYS